MGHVAMWSLIVDSLCGPLKSGLVSATGMEACQKFRILSKINALSTLCKTLFISEAEQVFQK